MRTKETQSPLAIDSAIRPYNTERGLTPLAHPPVRFEQRTSYDPAQHLVHLIDTSLLHFWARLRDLTGCPPLVPSKSHRKLMAGDQEPDEMLECKHPCLLKERRIVRIQHSRGGKGPVER
jgi:hypothetical protein